MSDLGATCPSCEHKAGFHVPKAEMDAHLAKGSTKTLHCRGALLPTPNLCMCRLTIEQVSETSDE